MALTVGFSCTQTSGLPNKINFSDTSTGTDATVSLRRIYIQTATGTYLVTSGTTTDYNLWSGFPTTTTITLDVLTQDTACSITVQWCTSGGTVVYSDTQLFGFTSYNEEFLYELTQDQSGDPVIIQDTNYYTNKMIMRVEVDSGDQAVELGGDITSAQSCYNRATFMRQNEGDYF